MKKILFCNIPMTIEISKRKYESYDISLPASESEVYFPVSSFLEKTLSENDELKAIMLVKKDKHEEYIKKIELFLEEISNISDITGAKIETITIDTEFSEEKSVHEDLLLSIIDLIDENSNIIADITYGPKDLPIVLFTAMNFAEKFLNCEIDNIVYGQATFKDGEVVETKLCDMIPLYFLNSITNTVQCSSAEKAKQMLKTLLSE